MLKSDLISPILGSGRNLDLHFTFGSFRTLQSIGMLVRVRWLLTE